MFGTVNWVQLAWPGMAAICLALAGLYAAVWFRRRDRRDFLMFAGTALSIAAVAGFEYALMHSPTAERAVEVLRWMHLPLSIMFLFVAGFVHYHFGGVRRELLAGLIVSRAAVVGLALGLPYGINYERVTGLLRIDLPGGASVSALDGDASPWIALASGSWLFLIALVAESTYVAWRQSPSARRRARIARLGGAMLAFFAGSSVHTLFVHAGLIQMPYFVTPSFFLVNLAMAAELIGDMVRASKLADSLRSSEARLQESETERELAVDAAGLALWSFDGVNREFQAPKRFGDLFGFGSNPPYTLLAVVERVHPDDRERLRWEIDAAISSGRPVEIEVRVIAPGDRPHWVRCLGRLDRASPTGKPKLRGVCFEVTELRLAEERFRAIVESAPSALIIVDPAGHVLFGNQVAVELLGYSRDELDGLALEEVLPEALRDLQEGYRPDFAEQHSRQLMGVGLVGRRKDRTQFPVEVSLAPMPTEEGNLVVAMFTDTTERHEQELAAARQRAELSHLSRVAVLGELSASLAHEINQPLAAILSNAEAAQRYLARDPVDIGELREIVGDIMADDLRAGEVIRRLRAMLRKEELPRVPLSMNGVARDVLQIMHSDLINRGVAVELELAKGLPAVKGDPVQLQQVLLNLIVNACDAMSAPSNRRILSVRTRHEGFEVWTSIGDLGSGIAEAELERIFQPFVTSKAHGTGLGLSVCRTIVSLHEGRIWARNNPAGGATVTVALLAAGAALD